MLFSTDKKWKFPFFIQNNLIEVYGRKNRLWEVVMLNLHHNVSVREIGLSL